MARLQTQTVAISVFEQAGVGWRAKIAGYVNYLGLDRMSNVANYRLNRLLASLTSDSFERLRPHLQLVPLSLGQILHAAHI